LTSAHHGEMRTFVSVVVTLLVAAFLGPTAAAAPTSGGQRAACQRTLASYPEITRGTTSKAVRSLQCVLNDAGFGPLTVDGFYGPETQGAIKELTDGFECCIENPLKVRTWYWVILFTASHELTGLERGDSGIRVKTLQRALRADGGTLAVDGDFGGQTERALKTFQEKCGDKQTGRVDQQTLFELSQGGCGADG
jgi:peptidoglycan hydrolase-like protein with peptidoglycan-binding domain